MAQRWRQRATAQAQRLVALNRERSERDRGWQAQQEQWKRQKAGMLAAMRQRDRNLAQAQRECAKLEQVEAELAREHEERLSVIASGAKLEAALAPAAKWPILPAHPCPSHPLTHRGAAQRQAGFQQQRPTAPMAMSTRLISHTCGLVASMLSSTMMPSPTGVGGGAT